MVLCTYVMRRPTHNGDIIRYEPIAAIVWKYVSMNEDTFIYETRYLCTGHGRCNILLLCVLTYCSSLLHVFPPPLRYRLPRLLPSSSHLLLPSYAFIDWRSFDARVYAHIDEYRCPFPVLTCILAQKSG